MIKKKGQALVTENHERKKETKPLLHNKTYVSHLELSVSLTCCDLNQLPITTAHTQGRGHTALLETQLQPTFLDWEKTSPFTKDWGHNGGYGAVSGHRHAHTGENTPKTSPEQPKVLLTTPRTTAAPISAAYRRVWVCFVHSWWHQFYYNKAVTL